LKKICFAASFFGRSPYSIDKIRLNTKQISENGNDQTRLTIFYGPENNTSCFIEFLE